MSRNARFLEAARFYQGLGFHIFPCVYQGKRPAIERGLHSAFTDIEQARLYWGGTEGTPFNIAVRTGIESNLIVLDIDAKHDGFENLRRLLEAQGIPDAALDTAYVDTGGGGRHYYFRHPGTGKIIPNRTALLGYPGVDIRGDGGYVVAPPSRHESGTDYSGPFKFGAIKPLPEKIERAILDAKPHASTLAPINPTEDGLVVEGQRNDYLMRLGGAILRPGLHRDALRVALQTHNERVCSPPLPEYEVDRIADNIARYTPSNPIALSVPQEAIVEEPWVRAADLLGDLWKYLSDKDQVEGKPTGCESFDKLLGGGKRLGEVTAWHAEAKTGKNSLWHFFMRLWLNRKIGCGYASREISPERDVIPNLLSIETKTNVWKTPLTDELKARYTEIITQWPLYFSRGYGAMEWGEIEAWVKGLHALGVEYFWFDHLHFMLEDPEDHKLAARLIKNLKTLAQQLSVHIDIIIQPNRLEEGKKLSMHSLKGGAVINQTVDNLIILERQEDHGIVEVKLELGRSKLVKRGKFYLQYNEDTTDFTEMQKEYVPAPKPGSPSVMYGNNKGFGLNGNAGGILRKGPLTNFNAKRIDDEDL